MHGGPETQDLTSEHIKTIFEYERESFHFSPGFYHYLGSNIWYSPQSSLRCTFPQHSPSRFSLTFQPSIRVEGRPALPQIHLSSSILRLFFSCISPNGLPFLASSLPVCNLLCSFGQSFPWSSHTSHWPLKPNSVDTAWTNELCLKCMWSCDNFSH